jgi:uncharacterized protein YndB with AHSA1/START domain
VARTSLHVAAPPERVWEVLSDPRSYATWVVGSKDIRRWDPEWPAPGAAFHHTFLVGPLPVKDSTSVLESDPPRRLKLRARARPTGVAHIVIELLPEADGTRVEIDEWPVEGPPATLHNPVQAWLIKRRNDESLRRLRRLAERR